jgi:uncharacterized membrane protein
MQHPSDGSRFDQPLRRLFAAPISCAILILVQSRCVCAADFSGIGFLNPGDNVSRVNALSSDGSVVAGVSYREYTFACPTDGPEFHSTYRRGFVWSVPSGFTALSPIDPNQLGYDEIYDVAPHGAAVFGGSFGDIQYFCGTPVGSYDARGLFEWTPAGGTGSTAPGYFSKRYSHNLEVYAGTQGVASFYGATSAYRRTPANGIQTLGWLGWPNAAIDDFHGPFSVATGISGDGSVVVGNSTSAAAYSPPILTVPITIDPNPSPTIPGSGPSSYNTEAFRWTEDAGMVGLGDLPGGDYGSVATGVSGDGRTIIGASAVENGSEGFRWTAETGMVPIGGLLPGGNSELKAVSFDGSQIVGSSVDSLEFIADPMLAGGGYYQAHWAAIIWDAQHGVRDLKQVLEADFGLSLAGWQITSAIDISDDGLTITGSGINPSGQEEGWVAHLTSVPEPSTFALSSTGILLFLMVCRTRRPLHVPSNTARRRAPIYQ